MPTFAYKAKNSSGNIVEGTMDAPSKQECIQRLRNDRLFIISVAEYSPINRNLLKYEIDFNAIFHKLFGRYSYKNLAFFCSNLNFLLQSGLTVYQSIVLIKEQYRKQMRKVLEKIESDLDGGKAFYEALAQHPSVFPPLMVELIRSGESSGNLEKMTEELAEYYEEQQMIRSQITTVMIYPILTVILTLVAMNYILLTVVPSISQMLEEYDAELPLITRLVILASNMIQNHWYFMIVGFILLLIVLRRVIHIPAVRERIDLVLLKIPMVSRLIYNTNLARFSKTLAVLLNSGISLRRALEMSSNILSNRVLLKGVMQAKERLELGSNLSGGLEAASHFPDSFIEIIKVGERSGHIDQVLFKVANQYNKMLQQYVKRLSAMLEPVLMLIVTGVVGFLMLSMFLPIVALMQSMAG